MLRIKESVLPNIAPIIHGDAGMILTWLTVLFLAGLSALLLSRYSADRFQTNKKKTSGFFLAIGLLTAVELLCFFGCSAITVKGIVFSLILLLSSFEDIRTRESDDFLHVMILIAGLIGTKISDIPFRICAMLFVVAIILIPCFFTKDSIGGADIKISAASAFLLGLRRGLIGLTAGLIIAVLVNLIKNRKNPNEGFPMIPYLAVSFMAAYFI